jgi:hypothetical protein
VSWSINYASSLHIKFQSAELEVFELHTIELAEPFIGMTEMATMHIDLLTRWRWDRVLVEWRLLNIHCPLG